MKPSLISSIALTASLLASQAALASPSYLPTGAQANVALSTITSGGWSQCYASTMDVFIGNSGEKVLNACTGDYLMMAGRQTGANNFLALAAALRADTIVDTGKTSNTHLANGALWYYSSNWSWGFTAAGDTVTLNQCDTSNSPLSMCLHTVNGAGGYRINNNFSFGTNYEKVFFQASASQGNAVPEPGSMALVGAALLGLAAVRKRKSV